MPWPRLEKPSRRRLRPVRPMSRSRPFPTTGPCSSSGLKPPMVSFAQVNQRDGFFIAARTPKAQFEWSDLLEGGLLFVHGGQPQAMLRYALHLRGVDLAGVQAIDRGSTRDMLSAFRSGEGAWFHEQGPYPQQLEHEGRARVVASVGEVIGPVSFSTLAAKREWLDTPEAVRFMRAYRAARAWANTASPQEIAAAERPFFADTEEPALARAIAAYQTSGNLGRRDRHPAAAVRDRAGRVQPFQADHEAVCVRGGGGAPPDARRSCE